MECIGQRVQDGDTVPDLRQSALAAALDDARRLPDLLHVLDGQVELKQNGYIQWTTPFRTNTSVEGVFAFSRALPRANSP